MLCNHAISLLKHSDPTHRKHDGGVMGVPIGGAIGTRTKGRFYAMTGDVRSSRPSAEQLASLSRLERAAFDIADFFARPELTPLSATWNSAFMGALIWSCGGRRFNVIGLEHLAPYGKKDSVLLVSNHRSFFDFF